VVRLVDNQETDGIKGSQRIRPLGHGLDERNHHVIFELEAIALDTTHGGSGTEPFYLFLPLGRQKLLVYHHHRTHLEMRR
jgi:hypothetical protein